MSLMARGVSEDVRNHVRGELCVAADALCISRVESKVIGMEIPSDPEFVVAFYPTLRAWGRLQILLLVAVDSFSSLWIPFFQSVRALVSVSSRFR